MKILVHIGKGNGLTIWQIIPNPILNIDHWKLSVAHIYFDRSLNFVGVQFKVPVMWVLLTLHSNAVVTLSALTNNQFYQIPSTTFYLWYPGCLAIGSSTTKSTTIVLDIIRNAANANGSWCWCWPHLNMQLKQCLQKPSHGALATLCQLRKETWYYV